MFSLSSYFSVQYLVLLLPATVGLYAVLPQKPRRVVLLLASGSSRGLLPLGWCSTWGCCCW